MKECFMTQKGPKAAGPYSTAVTAGDTVYLSGMIGTDPATGKLAEGGAVAQARQTLDNIKTVLEEMGLSMDHVVKATVLLADIGQFAAVNEIYAGYFGPNYPARSCFQVAALPVGAQIEIEVIAAKA